MLRTRTWRSASPVMVLTAILAFAFRASADDHPVPITGQYNAMITSATPAADGLHVTTAGEGTATHLGRITSQEQAVIHPDGTVQSSIVLTAANGDQLLCSEMGFTSGTTFAGTLTFTGGTGQFSNASGMANFNAVLAPDGVHFSFTFEGSIRY